MNHENKSSASESVRMQKLGVQRYLDQHKIGSLLTRLLENLIYNAPDDPQKHLACLLREFQALKFSGVSSGTNDDPELSIFTKESLERIFDIYDGQKRGSLTRPQFDDAMKHLGIMDYTPPATEAINLQLFTKEAKFYLGKSIGLWE